MGTTHFSGPVVTTAGPFQSAKGFLATPNVVTAATYTLDPNTDGGAITPLNRAAGIAVTLPAATGSGVVFVLPIVTAVTSNTTTIKVANANDFMFGNATQTGSAGAVTAFGTSNSGTAATESDTITFNGSTTGGLKGDIVYLCDAGANMWIVEINGRITGTAATPFSATV